MADLSTRYATALFELSLERGLTADFLEQAAFISATMREAECKRIITHPRIPEAEKFVFLDNVFAGRIHDDLLGFMRLTVSKNREDFLAPALDVLVNMIRRHQNHTTAKVVSAIPLTPEQESQLMITLTRKLGKTVELSVDVDATVIGGFRLHVDGYVFDHTLRYLLKGMKENLRFKT
ncbi:MAG: ATP synthase F1 subunit delta [Defluviitaleaceae bacterium]|nr:ATP synthase F1 subunit delta [Defluviitaleaceae bacterium]